METKEQVNLTLWFKTIERAFHRAPAGPRKTFLGQMLLDINRRLPVREAAHG